MILLDSHPCLHQYLWADLLVKNMFFREVWNVSYSTSENCHLLREESHNFQHFGVLIQQSAAAHKGYDNGPF